MIKHTAEQVEAMASWYEPMGANKCADMLRAYAALLREQELEAANRSKCRRFQSLMDDVDDD